VVDDAACAFVVVWVLEDVPVALVAGLGVVEVAEVHGRALIVTRTVTIMGLAVEGVSRGRGGHGWC